MKFFIFAVLIICFANYSFANEIKHESASDCQIYPVEIQDKYQQWYGSGGSYRQDTYSLKLRLKVDKSKLDGEIKRVGFTYVDGKDMNGKKSATTQLSPSRAGEDLWELSLDYYLGGFYGYRPIRWEGVFFVETETNHYYWLQSAPFENLEIKPEVELGPTSYHILQLKEGELDKLFNRINIFGCSE